MDFAGQKLAEQLCLYMILFSGVVSFAAGFATSSFGLMIKVYGGGVVLALVTCVPDWPWFRRERVTWLPPEAATATLTSESGPSNKSQAKSKR